MHGRTATQALLLFVVGCGSTDRGAAPSAPLGEAASARSDAPAVGAGSPIMGRWFEEGIEGGFAIRVDEGRLVTVMDGMVQRDLDAAWARQGEGWAAPSVTGGDLWTVEPDPRGVRFCERGTCYTLRPARNPDALDEVVATDDGSDTSDLCSRAESCCLEGHAALGGHCDLDDELGVDPAPAQCEALMRGMRSLLEERGLPVLPDCDG